MKVAVVLIAAIASVHSGSVRMGRQGGWPSPGWSTAAPTTQGWSTPPPTTAGWTTPGWATEPPTTQGWSTPPPTTQGWNPPPTQGWTTLPPTTQGWTTLPPTTQAWGPPPSTQGWNPPPTTQGWSAPPAPSGWGSGILSTIDLNAALAAAGSGWAAENHNENVAATGAGGWGPNAEIVIGAGGSSLVDQAGGLLQVTNQDSQGAASLNNVAVEQIAQGLEGEQVSALGLDVSNLQQGSAGASGEGASAADATSSINIQNIAASLGMNKP